MATVAAGLLNVYGLCVGTQPGTGPAFPQGSVISRIKAFSPSLTPAQVAANTSAEEAFAVTGVAADDRIIGVSIPGLAAGSGLVGARVSAVNEVSLSFMNTTAAPVTPTAGVYEIVVVNVDTN